MNAIRSHFILTQNDNLSDTSAGRAERKGSARGKATEKAKKRMPTTTTLEQRQALSDTPRQNGAIEKQMSIEQETDDGSDG